MYEGNAGHFIKHYTPKELAILKDMSLSNEQVAEMIGRKDGDVIYQKRRRMGLLDIRPYNRNNKKENMSKKYFYTPQELEIVKDTTISHEDASRLINRSIGSVYAKRKALGVKLDFSAASIKTITLEGRPRTLKTPLSEEQVKRLLVADADDIKKLAKEANRTLPSLYATRSNIKKRMEKKSNKRIKNQVMTQQDIQELMDADTQGIKDLAQRLGRTTQSLYAKRHQERKRRESGGSTPIISNSHSYSLVINGSEITVDKGVRNIHIGKDKLVINF